ncbi:hypothetical protein [Parasitella parasitica]|uniref:Methyltransferase domain-containing protein n=1 Tax=Parasitella parasitica TaxID=35722 RepID=A0A0B7NIW1_9FUNG|nr:hypothetical protein [Parasitella parasitica]
MGNSHSAQYHKSRFPRRRSFQSTHSVNLTTSALHTPGLSRSSSRTTSRPASVMGDVKDCVSKILGRSSSAFDVSLQSQRSTPRRSFSAPAGCFGSAMLNPSSSSCTATTTATKYCLPLDEKEQDRLTNTHYVLKHCFGDNFSAPVHDLLSKSVSIARASVSTTFTKDSASVAPSVISTYSASSVKNSWSLPTTRVLDVACGSGVWLLEMATEYPHAQFYGIDVASIFPQCIKPPNTTFQQHDLLDKDGFPYPEEHFDYIHMRLVYNCFSKADLKFVLAEVNRILKPGGYVEIRDLDPIIKHPGPLSEKTFADFATRMSQLNSVDVTWTPRICEILASQGELTDIYHQKVSVGFGEDGPIAASMESSICDAIKSYKTFFMEAYKLSSAQCEKMIDEIIQESKSHHSYFNYYMGWGRKPLIVMDTLVNNNDCMAPVTPTASSTNIAAVVDGSALASPSMASSTSATTALNCCVNTFPTANATTTLSVENAFDIVQLTHGYTE